MTKKLPRSQIHVWFLGGFRWLKKAKLLILSAVEIQMQHATINELQGILAHELQVGSKHIPGPTGSFYRSMFPVHPRELTWNIKIAHLKRNMIFQTFILGFNVEILGV